MNMEISKDLWFSSIVNQLNRIPYLWTFFILINIFAKFSTIPPFWSKIDVLSFSSHRKLFLYSLEFLAQENSTLKPGKISIWVRKEIRARRNQTILHFVLSWFVSLKMYNLLEYKKKTIYTVRFGFGNTRGSSSCFSRYGIRLELVFYWMSQEHKASGLSSCFHCYLPLVVVDFQEFSFINT